jgi:hypothetical protein
MSAMRANRSTGVSRWFDARGPGAPVVLEESWFGGVGIAYLDERRSLTVTSEVAPRGLDAPGPRVSARASPRAEHRRDALSPRVIGVARQPTDTAQASVA